MELHLVYIFISLLFSAFFSGMEIAYVSSNRMLAEMKGHNSNLNHRMVEYFYSNPSTFVTTMLVGNNIALVIYGIGIAYLLDNTIFLNEPGGIKLVGDTILSTIIVLFLGEFLPKTIFKNNANSMLSIMAFPTFICYIVLYPLSKSCAALSKCLLRLLGVNLKQEKPKEEFTKVELDYLVQQSDNPEVKIFHNALDLADTKVRDCMVPRTEINAIEKNAPLKELRDKFVESGNSKLIVYSEDIDHVIGYIHTQELFRIKKDWNSHIQQISFVPETMAVRKLMENLMAQKKSIAIVVDEFGGTSGLVSLEDIVEEIIGEIEDEHDITNYECRQTADGGYLVSARLEIEKINETLGIELPESEDYKTLGGLILTQYQSFPKLNEVVTFDEWECKILKNTKTKIELVKLTKIDEKFGD
jgi:CBS domain containing-hemolysin-like protein